MIVLQRRKQSLGENDIKNTASRRLSRDESIKNTVSQLSVRNGMDSTIMQVQKPP